MFKLYFENLKMANYGVVGAGFSGAIIAEFLPRKDLMLMCMKVDPYCR